MNFNKINIIAIPLVIILVIISGSVFSSIAVFGIDSTNNNTNYNSSNSTNNNSTNNQIVSSKIMQAQPTNAQCKNLPITNVVASANTEKGNTAKNVIDSKVNLRWAANGVGTFIQADLGSIKTICSLGIAWYKGDARHYNFDISVSKDGNAYTKAFSGTSAGKTSQIENNTFREIDGRYIKVTVNGNSENDWASITEMRVDGLINSPSTATGQLSSSSPSSPSQMILPTNNTNTSNHTASIGPLISNGSTIINKNNSTNNQNASSIKNTSSNHTASIGPLISNGSTIINKNNSTNNIKTNTSVSTPKKLVVLAFDDSLKSQYIFAKPILDKYGFKGTFFTVCNYVGRNNDSKMNWTQIKTLQKGGHDIESHTMNHKHLSKLSDSDLQFEIGQSKQCLVDHGINATIFGYPFADGSDKAKVVDVVAKYYRLARTGGDSTQFLNCVGPNNAQNNQDGSGSSSSTQNQPPDCRPYTSDGKLTTANRYSIRALTQQHDSGTDDTEMLQKFIGYVNKAAQYNNSTNGTAALKAFAVLKYHEFMDGQNKDYRKNNLATSGSLFETEMKYLHDNGFKVIRMSDLGYDAKKNLIFLKSCPDVKTCPV
jgi:peptidoglycan/xylan/chitin deacetylase (PgdA/CDA1 family)